MKFAIVLCVSWVSAHTWAQPREDVGARDEFRREAVQFFRQADLHRGTRSSLERRDFGRQRRIRQRRFAGELEHQLRIEHHERERAIIRFERFVREYPANPQHTPDAMFRLGELYYQRSELQDEPDYTPSLELYERLLRDFPQYTRAGAVLYLIGYMRYAMGEEDAAKRAWLRTVCTDTSVITATTRYASCQTRSSPFVDETWLRLGELHFDDFAQPDALDWAISAYERVSRTSRHAMVAQYKIGWSHYRANRYPEAIRAFARVVDQPSESVLRNEALQYMAISFAYDDWNENQVPDPSEQLPTALERISDPSLLPQDRPWTAEVFVELGQVLFDEAKYDEAIRIWRVFLRRWPDHAQAPDVLHRIAQAHERRADTDAAQRVRGELARFDLDHWAEHQNDLQVMRHAEERVERTILELAIDAHQRAQAERRRAVQETSTEHLEIAKQHYHTAAAGYREYLRRYPNSPHAYELSYNLADAYFWSESYEDAEQAYARVRDSFADDRYHADAARGVVESLRRQLDPTQVPQEPEVIGREVQTRALPALVQRLFTARETYLHSVRAHEDTESLRDAYAYNNATLLYAYGQWDEARERLTALFESLCQVDELGHVAWDLLYAMAARRNDVNEAQRLDTRLREGACSFGPRRRPTHVDVMPFRRATVMFERAVRATVDQDSLYELAAELFIETVNNNPDHPSAPLGLEYAAMALERTGRFDSARQLYVRIVDTVSPRQATDATEQERNDQIVSNALFRTAYLANRTLEYDVAVRHYAMLVDAPRFASSQNSEIQRRRSDALHNLAVLYELRDERALAQRYYRRLANDPDPDNARVGAFKTARLEDSPRDAVRAYRSFVASYMNDRAASELILQALWRIAETEQQASAYREVVSAYGRLGISPGSAASGFAAQAQMHLAEHDARSPRIRPAHLRTDLQRAFAATRARIANFDRVHAYRRPLWTVRALVAQGQQYDALSRAIMSVRVRGSLVAIQNNAEDETRCESRKYYLQALELARQANVDDVEVQHASRQLAVTASCPNEPTVPRRAPRGMQLIARHAPPPLAR